MKSKTRSMKSTKKNLTGKESYQAKIETLRRKEIRNHKYLPDKNR